MNIEEPQNPTDATPQTPGDTLSMKTEARREVVEFIKLVVWFLVLFVVLRTYVIEGYEVQGPSMNGTLQDRERILVFKLPHLLSKWSLFENMQAVRPGDIVVFDSPDESNKRYVKRVLAKGAPLSRGQVAASGLNVVDPATLVRVRYDRGIVYVNSKRVQEPYLSDKARSSPEIDESVLYPGTYYVLGDNRPESKDSRRFGPIEDDRIVGKVVFRFWPLSRIGRP